MQKLSSNSAISSHRCKFEHMSTKNITSAKVNQDAQVLVRRAQTRWDIIKYVESLLQDLSSVFEYASEVVDLSKEK